MAWAALVVGSATPSVYLARGQRRLVPLNAAWQALIDRGYVDVLGTVEVRLGRQATDGR